MEIAFRFGTTMAAIKRNRISNHLPNDERRPAPAAERRWQEKPSIAVTMTRIIVREVTSLLTCSQVVLVASVPLQMMEGACRQAILFLLGMLVSSVNTATKSLDEQMEDWRSLFYACLDLPSLSIMVMLFWQDICTGTPSVVILPLCCCDIHDDGT